MVEDLNTKNYALGVFVLFGSTKRKLDLPSGSEYDFHLPNKVNYSIPCPNTISTRACIEEFLIHDDNVLSHTNKVLESECP